MEARTPDISTGRVGETVNRFRAGEVSGVFTTSPR